MPITAALKIFKLARNELPNRDEPSLGDIAIAICSILMPFFAAKRIISLPIDLYESK
jgi:hypothetical protein